MEYMCNKEERRVRKTKALIRNAFIELICNKKIDEITVTDISKTADINRKTFYSHYKGVYQLMDEIENEIVSDFDNALKDLDFNSVMNNPYIIFSVLTEIINKNMNLYDNLSKQNQNAQFINKITEKVKEKIQVSFYSQIMIDEQSQKFIVDYTVSGLIAVYQSWFCSGKHLPLTELSKMLSTLCFYGCDGLLNQYKV